MVIFCDNTRLGIGLSFFWITYGDLGALRSIEAHFLLQAYRLLCLRWVYFHLQEPIVASDTRLRAIGQAELGV